VCLLGLVSLSCGGRSTTVWSEHKATDLESRATVMNTESSQNDTGAGAAAALSGIVQRLVGANLFPAEYAGSPQVAGPGVPLSGLPFDVDARVFAGSAGMSFVRLHDSFSGKDHWYTQGAIEAADVGEKIGRTWGTARWPAPISPPPNLSGDRHISAAGEDVPVAGQVAGMAFRLFRTADGVGYMRMTDPAGRVVWFRAALVDP
jgi:hypothetical protein